MTETIDRIEELYDWRHKLGGATRDYRPIAQADVDLLGKCIDLSTAKVCDVGCGGGTHLRALLEAGASFPIGIDLSGRALTTLLEGNDANRLLLIRGDITLWRQREVFDAVICSLPPLAHEGRMCLRALTCTLYSLLSSGGVLLLKLFTQESAPSIIGTYAVQYEGAEVVLCSAVSLSECGFAMTIKQYVSDAPNDIWFEEIAIPSLGDVRAAFNEAGFVLMQVIDHGTLSLPGTQTFAVRV